jgi:glycerophosphoryl diester phosphodiesterase
MTYIAHRGYGNNIYNDNSFDAYENAFNNNFDMIEMDVQLCKSGEVIIYHDIYIKNKLIRNINYCDLLPNGIKTFKDFLIKKYNKNMNILLDIKGNHINVVDKILILCNKFNVNYSKIWMSSFNKIVITDLIKFKNIYKYAVGLISDNNFYYDEIKYQLDKINFISINFEMLISSGEELLNECKRKNIKIICNYSSYFYCYRFDC